MKNYLKVIAQLRRYPFSVLGSIALAFTVGLLWSVNIGTLLPMVHVTLEGDSAHDWVQRKQVSLEEEVATRKAEIAGAQGTERLVDKQDELRKAEFKLSMLGHVAPYANYLPKSPFMTIVLLCGCVMVMTLIRLLCLVSHTALGTRIAGRVGLGMQQELFAHVLSMDQEEFNKRGPSDAFTRLRDATSVSAGLQTLLGSALREPLKMIFCLVGAGLISWQLLLMTLALAPIAAIALRFIGKGMLKSANQEFSAGASLNNIALDAYYGLPTVQGNTAEEHEIAQFKAGTRKSYRRRLRMSFFGSLPSPVTEFIGLTAVCATLCIGAYLVLNQQTSVFGIPVTDTPLSLPALLVFFGMLLGIHDPARRLSSIFAMLVKARVCADRIYGTLDYQPSIRDPEKPVPMPSAPFGINFDNISFAYEEKKTVISELSLTVKPGEKIALVGGNGCGKSTLVKLLIRFIDPVEGEVSINGVSLKNLRLKDLRSEIGYVSQNAKLFDTTVMENIRYGVPEATDEEVIEAAKKAHADEFINDALSSGYKTKVGSNGTKLSGGQCQRIALARIILRNPKIVIFDEATSQIDPESEALIHNSLESFLVDRTAILITHRFSTLAMADRIAMMEKGHLLDFGTHEQLVKRCPAYNVLWNDAPAKAA